MLLPADEKVISLSSLIKGVFDQMKKLMKKKNEKKMKKIEKKSKIGKI